MSYELRNSGATSVSEEAAIRDKIIRATNNQSSVELASLTATDKIQRDIEAILEQENWFYERRKNYYKNIGKPVERFVAPLFLAVGVIALIRKNPQRAGRPKSSFMKHPASYAAVFSDKFPINIWPKIASTMKLVDQAILEELPKKKNGPRILATWRGAVALCAVAEVLGRFDYSVDQLLNLDASQLSEARIKNIFEYVTSTEVVPQPPRGRGDLVCTKFGVDNGLDGIEVIGRWHLPSDLDPQAQPWKTGRPKGSPLDEAKVQLVADALPPQPWKPGVQHRVAQQTGLSVAEARQAINQLIAAGEFHDQRQGVVFDANGIIVAIDAERAETTLRVGDVYAPAKSTPEDKRAPT